MQQTAAIVLVVALTGTSLGAANVLRDRAGPTALTRWTASVIGGLAYLVAVLWLEPWMALVLSVSGLVFIALLRLRGTSALRGLRSTSSADRAELGYPAAAAAALADRLVRPARSVAGVYGDRVHGLGRRIGRAAARLAGELTARRRRCRRGDADGFGGVGRGCSTRGPGDSPRRSRQRRPRVCGRCQEAE
jgi:hypothetical protein